MLAAPQVVPAPFASLHDGPLASMFGPDNPWLQPWIAPWRQAAQALGSQFSPYQLNPLNLNPLRDVLAAEVDFERLRADRAAFPASRPDLTLADAGWPARIAAMARADTDYVSSRPAAPAAPPAS